jgi:hypothetical protein
MAAQLHRPTGENHLRAAITSDLLIKASKYRRPKHAVGDILPLRQGS